MNLNHEIIDILTDEFLDFRGIVIALAKRNPEILYAIVKGDDQENFEDYIYNTYKNDKVRGVKYIREKTNMGLKEAVDYLRKIITDREETVSED